jgi:hypothetical protein
VKDDCSQVQILYGSSEGNIAILLGLSLDKKVQGKESLREL